MSDVSIDAIHRSIRKLGGEGILTIDDIDDFSEAKKRIFTYMSDGEWHDGYDIKIAATPGDRPMPSGLRRMRELRDLEGVQIDRRRPDEGREFEYRLKVREPGQKSLFGDDMSCESVR